MLVLKGFLSIKALTNNTLGVVSALGEASTWSLTYTKERGEYEKPSIPGFRLTSISTSDSILGKVALDTDLADHVLAVSQFMYNFVQGLTPPIDRIDFSDNILAQFNGVISNLNFGPFVTQGATNLPEWVSWKCLTLPDNEIRIWISDTAFSEQFDESETVVIAPLDNLDDFFLAPTIVNTRISARSLSASMDLVQAAKGKNPETVIRTESYDYKNVSFPGNVFPTNWTVLIYGITGDNPDAIKDSIIEYILAHSTHTRQEWTELLPDLFKRTEFIILPRWDKYAIPNLTTQAGIYSPIESPVEMLAFVKSHIPNYDPAHIDANLQTFSHPYKCINLACIGGPDNRDALSKVTDLFDDFIDVSTASLDFNRMLLATQNWSALIEEMLIVAESVGTYTTIPSNMRRITRSGVMYIVAVYANVQYLVAAKLNYGL